MNEVSVVDPYLLSVSILGPAVTKNVNNAVHLYFEKNATKVYMQTLTSYKEFASDRAQP